jgi:hypothetical protein
VGSSSSRCGDTDFSCGVGPFTIRRPVFILILLNTIPTCSTIISASMGCSCRLGSKCIEVASWYCVNSSCGRDVVASVWPRLCQWDVSDDDDDDAMMMMMMMMMMMSPRAVEVGVHLRPAVQDEEPDQSARACNGSVPLVRRHVGGAGLVVLLHRLSVGG